MLVDPLPELGVAVIQLFPFVTVQAQEPPVDTTTEPEPPAAGIEVDDDPSAYEHVDVEEVGSIPT